MADPAYNYFGIKMQQFHDNHFSTGHVPEAPNGARAISANEVHEPAADTKGYAEIKLKHESIYLLPQRAFFRPMQKQLVLSDIRLGKASHFRKKAVPLPSQSHLRDIDRLHYLVELWKPETVLILGDLFHGDYNREWLRFRSLLMHYSHVQFILVEGNHDILPRGSYIIPNLLKIGWLEERHFVFSDHPLPVTDKLNICGHVHPGLRLTGTARQSISLPCFCLSSTHFILPAFGDLTGLKLLDRQRESSYYLITNDCVVNL